MKTGLKREEDKKNGLVHFTSLKLISRVVLYYCKLWLYLLYTCNITILKNHYIFRHLRSSTWSSVRQCLV